MRALTPGPLGRAAPRAGAGPPRGSAELRIGIVGAHSRPVFTAPPGCGCVSFARRLDTPLAPQRSRAPAPQALLLAQGLHFCRAKSESCGGRAPGRRDAPRGRCSGSAAAGGLSPRGADPDLNFQGTRCRRARSSPDASSHAGPGPSGSHGSEANARSWSPHNLPSGKPPPEAPLARGPADPGSSARERGAQGSWMLSGPNSDFGATGRSPRSAEPPPQPLPRVLPAALREGEVPGEGRSLGF